MSGRSALAIVLAVGAFKFVVPDAKEPDAAPTLKVIMGGINTRGTGMLPGVMPDGEGAKVFRISLDASTGDDRSIRHRARGYIQRTLDSGADPPGTSTISVRDPSDSRLAAVIGEIARTPNAVVHIDMDLAMLGRSDWQDQTPKAGRIAALIGEERARALPQSRNGLYTHSAGTMGLSHLILAKKGHLYQDKLAASPMTSKLTRDVVIVQARGDLPSTEGGYNLGRLTGAALDPEGWVDRGNTVIRISGVGFDVRPTTLGSHIARAMIPPGVSHILKHIQASAWGTRDQEVEVLRRYQYPSAPGEVPSPENLLKLTIPNISPGQLIRVLEGNAGPSVTTPDKRRTPIDQLKDHIRDLEPPKGGGIALRAAADLPFASDRIASAAWDSGAGQFVIRGRSGETWRVPRMDVEVVATAYRCLFNDRPAVPEFSIGAPLDDTREHVAQGKSATYFRPDRLVRFSKLGFLMYQADVALGDIAYGGTSRLAARRLTELAGFHSLPEMFPGKYSRESEHNVGTSDRVVIQSLPAKLTERGQDLVFETRNEFAVRFGRTAAAERAYAELFAIHQQGIVERVPELQRLLGASRAVGVLLWIRDNQIPFEPGELTEVAVRSYETPAQVVFEPLPSVADIAERLPLVQYNEYGPTTIRLADDQTTQVTYGSEHVQRIVRHDGKILEVLTDDRGEPLGVEISGEGAAAFSRTTDGYALFYDDVVLHRGGGGLSFERKAGSGAAPEKNPRALVNTIARGFVAFADRQQNETGSPTAPGGPPGRGRATQPAVSPKAVIAGSLIVLLSAGLLIWRRR